MGHKAAEHIAKYGISGWYTKSNERRMVELMGERLPDTLIDLRKESTNKGGIGYQLVRRGAFCVSPILYSEGKDELRRFLLPSFSSTHNALTKTNDRLTYNRLQELQETEILLAYKDEGHGPGVYLKWNLEMPQYIYVGSSKTPIDRSRHTELPQYTWDMLATADYGTAEWFEREIHKYLREVGTAMRDRGKGQFKVNQGNALEIVRAFIRLRYSRIYKGGLFHNTCVIR